MPNNSRLTVFDCQGRTIQLGNELGKGGEGSVFDIVGQNTTVAKVYHKPLSQIKSSKLDAMVSLRSERLTRLSAWPMEKLSDRNGQAIGFLMPKISGYKDVHQLYGPKSRLSNFDKANWPFLIQSAANIARAFGVIHELSHVVGDVNHGNLVVSQEAIIRLIDCDSFQITYNGQQFLCEVGVPTHTPPELQGLNFASTPRTPNHDCFGLAVLIFQILFMGRHPFSGQFLGPGDMPIERAIKEFRFAYGPLAKSRQMKQPPATLALEDASAPLATLFERAFSREGANGSRPKAAEWVTELSTLSRSVKQCSTNYSHKFFADLKSCPWCNIEARSGIVLFPIFVQRVIHARFQFDINSAWIAISKVSFPDPLPTLPPVLYSPVYPNPEIKSLGQNRKRKQYIIFPIYAVACILSFTYIGGFFAFVLIIVMLFIALSVANSGVTPKRKEIKSRLEYSRKNVSKLRERWNIEAGASAFDTKLRELDGYKTQYENIPKQKQLKLQQLQNDLAKRQLFRFLDGHKIDRASISGIGSGRKAVLQSYGIETAADIIENSVLSVPGFGPSLTGNLVAWRRSIEMRFVFNPSVGVDPADIQAVEQEYNALAAKIEAELVNGPQVLEQIKQQILMKRNALKPIYEEALKAVAQGEVDLKCLQGI